MNVMMDVTEARVVKLKMYNERIARLLAEDTHAASWIGAVARTVHDMYEVCEGRRDD